MAPVLRPGVLFLFLCLALAGRASADPIVVTGGRAFAWWDGTGSNATLLGDGFSVVTDTYDGGRIGLPAGVTNLDGTLTFGTLGARAHTWNVTVDGTRHTAFLDGFLEFDTQPFVVPRFDGPTSGVTVTFSTSFTMTGRLRGSTGAFGTGTVLFDVPLTGIGTASTVARPVTSDSYLINSGITYEFAAATPEPATLLLMGTGIAGILLRRRNTVRERRE